MTSDSAAGLSSDCNNGAGSSSSRSVPIGSLDEEDEPMALEEESSGGGAPGAAVGTSASTNSTSSSSSSSTTGLTHQDSGDNSSVVSPVVNYGVSCGECYSELWCVVWGSLRTLLST